VTIFEESRDYVTREIGGKDIILIQDGDINEMYNVFAHRGAKVLDDS